jgi:plastocyanin
MRSSPIRIALVCAAIVAVGCAPSAPAAATAALASTPPPPAATAAVRPSAAPPATPNPSPTVATGTVTVQLAEHFYTPSLITVAVGTTVVWVDVGQQTHDVHARDGSFDSPPLSPGNTFKFTFTKPGKYPYYCIPHEGDGMTGEVDVVAD